MATNAQWTTIGFIGIGVMGKSMASHLQRAGYVLHVYSRTRSKAEELIESGAVWHDAPGTLAEACDAVITMVGYPQDVEEIYLGPDGLVNRARPGSCLIDMTTSSPVLAKRIAEAAAARDLHALDAPVSGGDVGAREARLSIMVGGQREAFDAALPLLEKMGTNIVHQGAAGAGQYTKMCNQIAIASNMMGVCEALVYAEHAGLDPSTVLKSIESGAAGSWSLSNLAPRIIGGNFAPGFYVKHFIKDMRIALDSAQEMQLALPGLALACSLYEKLAGMGEADSGTQALYKVIGGQR
ncbi:NAD(P)-dependent oxidoreductase [Paenibacillus allorhizosphaerae]|uniref:2-hydroxy-3-oxopropionate reductase n=1 Tax=Paenibacillus allorhizosphaerae TaxID=2849866 RepID=A0ABN7TE20_9BACL|nr:NAD(P)-dependent oxidoreductase [Paenibacillus allorhizosphaerae]CAG7624957.1 2-hydroxy-3-oxopropionate reductase [Paenibacillus allorhizosphaerae]